MIIAYDREAAVRYAHRWAYGRNPAFYDYERIGGDCTNFASQCLYAGTGIMNPTPVFGWYYFNANDKAPAWTGVPYFYNFMTREEQSPGPIGFEVDRDHLDLLKAGDFVQLGFSSKGSGYRHTPIIVEIRRPATLHTILVAAHSENSDNRPLDTYDYYDLRFIHITGAFTAS